MVDEFKDSTDERSQKVVASIRGNEDFQYVLADFALTSLIGRADVALQPVTIHGLDSKRFMIYVDTSTHVYLYKNLGFDNVCRTVF